jgi:hypothetical protein
LITMVFLLVIMVMVPLKHCARVSFSYCYIFGIFFSDHHSLGVFFDCGAFVFLLVVMLLVCFLIVMVLCSSRLMWSCVILNCHGLVF